MSVRRHIVFSGLVQGVGFRYSAVHLAQPLDLTGWVRNLPDGRVEMEVQGGAAAIDEFLERLQNRRWIQIDHMDIRDVAPVEEREFTAIAY